MCSVVPDVYRFAFAVRFSIDSVVYNVVGEAYRMHGMVKRSMLKQKLYFNIFFSGDYY